MGQGVQRAVVAVAYYVVASAALSPVNDAICQVVPDEGAGLSVLGSVLRCFHFYVSFGSLARHKADITLKERYWTGKESREVRDVGCPAWIIIATFIIAYQ